VPIYIRGHLVSDHSKGHVNGIESRAGRGGHFDRLVTALAPLIRRYQSSGIHDIRKLAACLNAAGIPAPSGGPFTYATMRRVLVRMRELNLGSGPRTLSAAASQRPARPYKLRRVRPRQPIKGLEELAWLLSSCIPDNGA
jgi:hypothetical protein